MEAWKAYHLCLYSAKMVTNVGSSKLTNIRFLLVIKYITYWIRNGA